MATAFDEEAGFAREDWSTVITRLGDVGECGEQVGHCDSTGDELQLRQIGLQGRQYAFVEQLLARQRTVLRRQRLVLERLEFGCDVALGVLQRLPPAIVVGYLAGVRVGDLDVETMYSVVLDFEVGDAGAFALACLQLDEVGTAVVVDATQFVEFGVVTVGNDAALAQQGRRFRENRRTEQVEGRIGSCELIKELGEQRRSRAEQRCAQFGEAMQAVAQARQVARSGAEQCHATGDALDVGDPAQGLPD